MSSHRRAAALALAGLLALPTLAASEGFTARMSRLDALMGGARTTGPRSRSANALAD